jgi:hypothetical protein
VFTARGLEGVKVKMVSVRSWVMIPVTPELTVKVAVLIDEAFIASLKVAVMTAREHTPVAALAGVTATTIGGELHPLEAVLKLHTKSIARALPKVSLTPVVMVAL